jgi:signal transduction histidine kinase
MLIIACLSLCSLTLGTAGQLPDEYRASETSLDVTVGAEKVDQLLELSKNSWFQGFDESLEYATRAYQLAREIGYQEGIADAMNRIGNVHYLLSNYDEVLVNYMEAARIATRLNDHMRKGMYLNNIGLLYRDLSLHDSAAVYFHMALEEKIVHGDKNLISSTLGNLGKLYRDTDSTGRAMEYFSLQLDIAIELENYKMAAEIYRLMGETSYLDGQYEESLRYLAASLNHAKDVNDTVSIAHSYYQLARTLLSTRDFRDAAGNIRKSMELAEKISSLDLKRDNYKLFYQYYKKSGNFSRALENLTLYNGLKDSIRHINLTNRYTQLEKIFNIDQQNRRIELLQKDNQIQDLQISRHRFITRLLLVAALTLLFFIVFLIYRYTVIHRTHLLLKGKTAELEKANEKLRVSTLSLEQLNVTKNRFFSIIAHDLKNPFNALLGFSEIITTTFHELKENEIREYIGFVHQSSRNLYKLLENLLKWSATQTGTMQFLPDRFDLVSLINSEIHFLRIAASKKQIEISRDMPEDLIVNSDKLMLSSVIRNLTDNAIKFTHPGGNIHISVNVKGQQGVIVEITDSGIGIPADMQKKLFTLNGDISRKGTNKEEGGGLGLILCKEMIEKAGGIIGFESKQGKGSRFWFTLPSEKIHPFETSLTDSHHLV